MTDRPMPHRWSPLDGPLGGARLDAAAADGPSLPVAPAPLVLVHGFTQTWRSWLPLVEGLAVARRAIVAIDAPGHGRSSAVEADLRDGADLLAATCGRGVYVGYSMGARLCLHLAVRRPELVEGLVLFGATAGIRDEHERAARRAADERLADELIEMGVPAFVDRWLAGPLFSTLAPEQAQVADRLTNTAAGLASSLRMAGTGTQEPLWDQLSGLTMPVVVAAGSLDTKFSVIADELEAAIGPNATSVVIEGAGHACHIERAQQAVDAIVGLCRSLPRR